KHYHSINLQIICDAHHIITNVCAKCPGSGHDSYIFQQSEIYHHDTHAMTHLSMFGDSGYGLRPWVMTPLSNAETKAQVRYNHAHVATRCVIERTFGILKCRFRCLDHSGGALKYAPEKVCKIIVLCSMLYNLAMHWGMPDDLDETLQVPAPAEPQEPIAQPQASREGRRLQNRLIENVFTCKSDQK
ncbi:putative nuclease HARBI1, partial [Acipenser oxyrinchus oxyrinchus]